MLLVAVTIGLFSWDRWLRYDDAAEFQGSWQAHGTDGVVVIDGERINLTDDVAYSYRIDPMAKTISFTFGTLEGQGRYRFSLDRSQLVITEGAGYSWISTLVDDVGWMADQLVRFVQGRPQAEVLPGDGVTVFDRLPSDGAVAAQGGKTLSQEGRAADGDAGRSAVDADSAFDGSVDERADDPAGDGAQGPAETGAANSAQGASGIVGASSQAAFGEADLPV
ncbi:hypothetical protein [Gordonibacter sp. An230]|uniref:hypothetical protein n=1 Tax=Gordonibacter sp. An230 TaxID=1965592 RepID=UPI0011242686|nr:hypothetical protein [Gordonibacter sp. An230]